MQVILNGSQSMHGVYSISVTSRHPSSDAATSTGPPGDTINTPSAHAAHTSTTTSTSSSSSRSTFGVLPTSRRHLTGSPESPKFQEVLNITTWDTALVSPGHKTPFPIGDTRPALAKGMHFNLVNNVWGTNYVMWVPWSDRDVNLAFRWTVRVEQVAAQEGQGPQQQADRHKK